MQLQPQRTTAVTPKFHYTVQRYKNRTQLKTIDQFYKTSSPHLLVLGVEPNLNFYLIISPHMNFSGLHKTEKPLTEILQFIIL